MDSQQLAASSPRTCDRTTRICDRTTEAAEVEAPTPTTTLLDKPFGIVIGADGAPSGDAEGGSDR